MEIASSLRSNIRARASIAPNDAGGKLGGSQEVPRGLLLAGGDGTKLFGLDLGGAQKLPLRT